MSTLLNLFYRLPMEFIAPCFLLASLAFLWIRRRFQTARWFRWGIGVVLLLWLGITLWITILNRTPGTTVSPELIPFHSYRRLMETGNSEIVRVNFMNVALFYPAGLLAASLLPKHQPRWKQLLTAAAVFALLSTGIELFQYRFCLGEPEIDDVIHNALGGLLGQLFSSMEAPLLGPNRHP